MILHFWFLWQVSFYPDDAYLPDIRFLELALDGEYPNCTTDYVLIGEWKSHELAVSCN